MTTSAAGTVVREQAAPEFKFPLGNHGRLKAGRGDGMAFGFLRTELPEGTGMPLLHVHRSMDEAFEILRGSVQYRLGGDYVTVSEGDSVLVPAGVPHCFRALGASGASILLITSPAEGIDLIAELSRGNPFDVQWAAALVARYDTEFLETRPSWEPPVAR